MIIGFQSIWPTENQLFFAEDDWSSKVYGDNIFYPLLALKRYAEKKGVTLGNVNKFELEKIDAFVFHEMPKQDNSYFQHALTTNKPMFLFNFEPKEIYYDSHVLSNHDYFVKVFTNHDQYIDGKKYIKINPFCVDARPPYKNPNKTNLCTLISTNKWWIDGPNVLYSERLKAIEWFEQNHPESFEFFGYDWKHEEHPCYKGVTYNKIETLSSYKFAICYENIKDLPGYITEKIFDCFRAGCVPIYLGANNVTDYIPKQCFIDRSKFKDYSEMYTYISTMSSQRYNNYLKSITKFIENERGKLFSVDHFVKTMWNGLMEVIG